jgi:multicomponent Na+:H+ antiporter subunit F
MERKSDNRLERFLAILLTVISISLIVMGSVFAGRVIYLDVAMVYGILSFIGVVAVARYLEGGF